MNICQLTEKAVKSFLDSAGLTLVSNIYRGVEGSDTQASTAAEGRRSLPCVVVECPGAVPHATPSGNWTVTTIVRVMCNSDDKTETEFHAICQEVFGKILTDTFPTDISAFLGFTAFYSKSTSQNNTRLERHWENSITLEIFAAPSDIS